MLHKFSCVRLRFWQVSKVGLTKDLVLPPYCFCVDWL